jgi:ABC-type antimicrobial peptide transport system permease subunit
LGIAFLLSVVTSSAISKAIDPNDETAVGAAQKWLIVISILVCTIGITNSMLMSVTERYKEIGTMKCLGALNRFIIKMFLLESAFLGIIGSFAGALVGCVSMTLLRLLSDGMEVIRSFPLLPLLTWIGMAVIIGMILSVIGAIYPAFRAAKMLPADAMRVEI